MIIDSLGQTAKTNLKTERAEFSVSSENVQKFLHIAVRNLYSNPVQAICCELAQNSFDAHVLAGKRLVPFHISIPTAWNPVFSVRDFGAGISPDFMLDGYTKALHSTKDTDGDMSGGFGLGRLASLSLSSTYNVTTYIKGCERNYSIFESENGIEIIMTHERKTTEPDGTLVSAPVPTDKVSQFRDAANRAFRYYEVKPIIKGDSNFKIDEPKFALKGQGWAIEEGGHTTSAVCGIYHYPIDAKNVPNLTTIQQKLLGNVGLVMFFGASDLAPMANRQGLYYNDKTVAAIKKRLDEIEEAVKKEAQTKFDLCKSHYEAKMLWGKLFCGSVSSVNSILRFSDKITWNGIKIEHNRLENIDKVVKKAAGENLAINCTTFTIGWGRGSYKPKHSHGMTAIDITETHTIFINDLAGGRGILSRGKSFLREKYVKTNNAAVRASVLTFEDAVAKDAFFKHYNLNESDFEKLSTVVVSPTSREGASIARAKTKVFEWTGKSEWSRKDYSSCWKIAEIDLEEEEEGIYVGIERYSPDGFHDLRDLENKVKLLKDAKFLSSDFKLYGFRNNSKEYEAIKKNKDWISIHELIAKFVKEYVIPQDEIQVLVDAEHYSSNRYNLLFSGLFYYESLFPKIDSIKNVELLNYFNKVKFMFNQNKKSEKDKFSNKHAIFVSLGGSVKRDGVKPSHNLLSEVDALKKKLPILDIVSINDFDKLFILDKFLLNQK